MAELQKDIRKPGGDLVSARSPVTRRVLLPTEADMCNVLGITEEEYWQFIEQLEAKIKERPEAYDLIPDIRCDPVTSWIAANIVNIGIALVAAGVSYLLTPKPPSQKQGSAQRTADISGSKRFAPQSNFNTVQELANLGDLIPLVFTNRGESQTSSNPNGGIRVNSQMLWSQLVSLGRYQQLKLLALFSLGELEEIPNFEGYAIGDLLISNYHADKIYTEGGNIPFLTGSIGTGSTRNVFTSDIFKIDNQEYFCGSRNPTTQSAFGLSTPMPNCTYFSLPYELVRWGHSDKTNRHTHRKIAAKRIKLLGSWPMRAGFLEGGDALQKAGSKLLDVGTFLTYQIVGGVDNELSSETNYNAFQKPGPYDNYAQNGVKDVDAVTSSVRESTDQYLAEGEQYMAGTALVTCTNSGLDDQSYPGAPWEAERSKTRQYTFKVVEEGHYECLPNPNLGTHCDNPAWNTSGNSWHIPNSPGPFYYEQYKGSSRDLFPPHTRYALQKTTIGTVSDNRKCDITELGIKSKVFKQIQTANVQSKPTEDEIVSLLNNNNSVQLGQVSTFTTRISFFKVQIRRLEGGSSEWEWLRPKEENHSGLFCVKGNTPQFQYNYIRIDHPTDQYEYRFFPWPGNEVIKEVAEKQRTSYTACLLNARGATTGAPVHSFKAGNSDQYTVRFAGVRNYLLDKNSLSNKDWNLANPTTNPSQNTTSVSLAKNTYSDPEDVDIADFITKKTDINVFTKYYGPNIQPYTAGENHTVIVRFDERHGYSIPFFVLYINRADVTDNVDRFGATPEWRPGHKTYSTGSINEFVSLPEGGQTFKSGDAAEYGVEFHYQVSDSMGGGGVGLGGKFIPVLDPNLPGADAAGHPAGVDNHYYVRKIEQYNEPTPPVLSKLVTTLSEDGDDEIANGEGLQVQLEVYKNPLRQQTLAIWAIQGSVEGDFEGYLPNDVVLIPSQEDEDGDTILRSIRVPLNVSITSKPGEVDTGIPSELNPYDAAADFWKYQGDKSSHLDGPEHQLTYVNEIVKTIGDDSATYHDLAYAGLRVDSSKEWTNFTQFSAYIQKGIRIKKPNGWMGSTSLFPEIAYALLTDKKIGAGKVISTESVDADNMDKSAEFCSANGLFWDGMVTNRVNLREFIFEQSLYCLLDFTIIGGKFSLKPAVPYRTNDYKIDHSQPVKISALFTDGNIKDLQVNFLAPEDRQTYKANILYRNEKLNGFSETKSTMIRLVGTEHNDDPVETYDLSGFCTTEEHAATFGKYILSVREHLDHTVSFKTAPHYINGVQPGDYIRVFSTTNHTSRFNNGAILDDGTVVSKDTITGSKDFYYWNPSEQQVREATVNFSDSNAVKAFAGTLFTIKETEKTDQCYKVESITYGDDGLIDLTGSYTKLTSSGALAILQGWFDGTRFSSDD